MIALAFIDGAIRLEANLADVDAPAIAFAAVLAIIIIEANRALVQGLDVFEHGVLGFASFAFSLAFLSFAFVLLGLALVLVLAVIVVVAVVVPSVVVPIALISTFS